ncbi:MAG TPA: helix-turn-helix transcriptional regulator [Candidatus Eremiobacteraceae bacterium]|nr:helix-turn-helix transcriptional regulator [Candidatus Eremiobacteraceae bacterium]
MQETFAERLKRLREQRGLTVGKLALRAGLTEAAIRKMEYGDTKGHGLVNGLKLADALGVDPWELAFGQHRKQTARSVSTSVDARLRLLQESVAILAEIAKAGVSTLGLSDSQKRQLLTRLEKIREGDRIPS